MRTLIFKPVQKTLLVTLSTSVCLILATLTSVLNVSPVQAAGGTGTWGSWTATKTDGSLNLNVGGFTSPSATFTTNATGLSVSSGASTWLNTGTAPGAEYGTSRGSTYINMGTATGGANSTTTFTFLGTTPSNGWSFVLGDIDADAVTISATDANSNAVDVSTWTVTTFNYCNNTSPRPTSCAAVSADVPTWSAGTATVTGNGNDTDGASAWVQPNVALKSLTLVFKKQVGFPTYQLWFAGDTPVDQNYKLTLAARSCPNFTNIMANKVRNNLMQSLQDLGVDSLYTQSAFSGPVRPSVEDLSATGQDACSPMSGWTFGLSNGTNGKDTGDFGSLSKLKTPLSAQVTTLSNVPELDELGNNTGRTISGAITYNLTKAQIAGLTNKTLWVQGGIPGSPLNGRSDLAYGTLRCATDNANGDNVEWVGMSPGGRHVFCYAYYVSSAEQSGQIIIQKTVPKGGSGVNFGFSGNLSFNNNGAFSLPAGGSQTFVRAAGQQWDVSEDAPVAPFELTDLNCNSSNSTSTITPPNLITRSVSITLGAGDTVTCTFTNELRPKAKLELYKVSNGAVGTFGFSVSDSVPNVLYSDNTTVTTEGAPTLVKSSDGLAPGNYTVTETSLPSTFGGNWGQPTISCVDVDGNTVSTTGTPDAGSVVALNGKDVACIVENTFTPNAKIHVISKVTGGSGVISADSSYIVTSKSDASTNTLSLTNADWDDAGSQTGDLTDLPFGDYNITAQPPVNTDTSTWTLDSLSCDGGASYTLNDPNVDLTLDDSSNTAPEITCTYVWRITKLANITINKISKGDVGTFMLTASYNNSQVEGAVTTTSTDVAANAITLNGVSEGTPIILGETAIPTASDGQWNADNSGDPTWDCVDSASNPVAVNSANQFTSTDNDITCTATNTFTLDPAPAPSPSASGDVIEVDTKGVPLARTGGTLPQKSWWDRLFTGVLNIFE